MADSGFLTPVQRFQPRSMVEVLFSLAAEQRRLASECKLTNGVAWEAYRSRAILLEVQAREIQEHGVVRAHLRSQVLSYLRKYMDGQIPLPPIYGVIDRMHKVLEPKPLYATKRSICWGRYLEAEKKVSQ